MQSTQIAAIAAVAVVAVVAIGGGVAYSAKNAEPGDMFYSLHASLYGDDGTNEDADDLESARTAYNEAQSLENNGQLTASERARLTASYSMHVNAVSDRIADLEARGDMDAAAELRAELRDALRMYRDLFPITIDINESNASSSSAESSMMNEDTSSASSASDGIMNSAASSFQQSSIFVQPSSPITSA